MRVQPLGTEKGEWKKATVLQRNAIRSYEVLTEDNRKLRRNRVHRKKTPESQCDNTHDEAFVSIEPTRETKDSPTDDQTHRDLVPQKSPAKFIPRRSGRNRSKFTPYEHIP